MDNPSVLETMHGPSDIGDCTIFDDSGALVETIKDVMLQAPEKQSAKQEAEL